MIFKIKKYFKSKKNKSFQDELIDKLHREHEKLFEVVGKMDEAANNKDFKKLKKLIKTFKQELELHVLYEDTNLYEHLYVRYHYYPKVKEEIQKKHNDIKDIAVVVVDFIATHKNLASIEEFQKDFNIIKDVLVKRVSFEEEILYEIYSTNQKASSIVEKLEKAKKN